MEQTRAKTRNEIESSKAKLKSYQTTKHSDVEQITSCMQTESKIANINCMQESQEPNETIERGDESYHACERRPKNANINGRRESHEPREKEKNRDELTKERKMQGTR